MTIINLTSLSSKVKIYGGQAMKTRASITVARLTKVHEKIFYEDLKDIVISLNQFCFLKFQLP